MRGAPRAERGARCRCAVKLDKQTVALLVGLATTVIGGAELRLAVARLEDKVDRLEMDVSSMSRTAQVDE